MVALTAKPCDVKSHEVQICQYTACDDNTIAPAIVIVPMFVSHDVLGEVKVSATAGIPLQKADPLKSFIDVPDVERQESLLILISKNYLIPNIDCTHLQESQFY